MPSQEERDQVVLALLQRVRPMVLNFAHSSGMDFDDLYQEISITILNGLNRGLDWQNNIPLLLVSVKHRMIDLVRYRNSRRVLSLDAPTGLRENEAPLTLADQLADGRFDPATIWTRREQIQALHNLVEQPGHNSRKRKLRELEATALAVLEVQDAV